tara:strand:- start:833 stop:2095 length:1263 start_codon:yes stop_codon:yes gene_type:complete
LERINVKNEKALLVGVIRPNLEKDVILDHLNELELLAKTAGAIVVAKITQKVAKINPSTFIGLGKAQQVINQAKELRVSIIIFDDELSPAQIKNYHQKSKKIKVIDRSGLILDIFKQNARTKESTTQVELAYLQYLLPRLTRQWTHLERQMGGIGTRAGMGETQIEVDRRIVRTRINKLKNELKGIEKERRIQGLKRKSEFRVSLVGYTNAGKSTLFKALTGSDVIVENQLFATLDTTVRRLQIGRSHSILLSDTVGFIRKLPHNLVASFKSTLKEVVEADLIIKVLDISSPHIYEHIQTINKVLNDINASHVPAINVLNKVDLLPDANLIAKLKRTFPGMLTISAARSLKLSDLKIKIKEAIEESYETIDVKFSYRDSKLISKIQENVIVLERDYMNEYVKLKLRGSKARINKILSMVN